MRIICTLCGKTDVACEAMINPNNKQFVNYTDESFLYGWCENCKTGVVITDVNDAKSEMKKLYQEFCECKKRKPHALICDVVTHKDERHYRVLISIGGTPSKPETSRYFHHCENLDDLVSLCDYSKDNFIIVEWDHFL